MSTLSPSVRQTTSLLLELALLSGVTVRGLETHCSHIVTVIIVLLLLLLLLLLLSVCILCVCVWGGGGGLCRGVCEREREQVCKYYTYIYGTAFIAACL